MSMTVMSLVLKVERALAVTGVTVTGRRLHRVRPVSPGLGRVPLAGVLVGVTCPRCPYSL